MKDKNNKSLKRGSLSLAITLFTIIAIIEVNVLVANLPTSWTRFDASTTKLSTLTQVSVDYLEGLTRDVQLYYICEGGKEDETILRLLERYRDSSPHVFLEQIDPALYPSFVSGYTDELLENNSVIVTSGTESKTISFEVMYQTAINAKTLKSYNVAFDGEGQITSAIDYCVNPVHPVLYTMTGSGERDLPKAYKDALKKSNVDVKAINLFSEEVPEDCAALMINAPAYDYAPETVNRIGEYLEKGGKAIIMLDYSPNATPYLNGLLANYGLGHGTGVILEGDTTHYSSYQYCLVPELQYGEVTKGVYDKAVIMLPMAQPIGELEDMRKSITHTAIMTTTAASYQKADPSNLTTMEKEAQDAAGPFTVGMLVQEDINNDGNQDTELIYISTGYLLEEEYNNLVSNGNARLVGDMVGYLCAKDAASAVAAKTLSVKYLTMTDSAANILSLLCIFVLPGIFVVWGLMVWLRRRKG